jgi:hypothetical protein
VLLNCHAGCAVEEIVAALGLTMGDLFEAKNHDAKTQSGRIVAEYPYTDENGTLLYQVVRFDPKRFRQRRRDGNGTWTWNLRGVRRVLYGLTELVSRPDERVFVVEGEKDADRLRKLTLLATTNSGGADKWKPEYSEYLRGRDVVILPDNDALGRDHAQAVALALNGVARSIKVVPLPGLHEKEDVSDWLDAGHTISDLHGCVDASHEWRTDQRSVERAIIQVNDRQQRDIIDDAWSAVHACNDPPQVFTTAGLLARLVPSERGARMQRMDEADVYGRLLRVADWISATRKGSQHAKPPKEIPRDFLANPNAELPVLDAVIRAPFFDCSGQLITRPGYHRDSHLWYDKPQGFELPPVPDHPTKAEIAAALTLLREELLGDFPFGSPSDQAHALAAMVVPFVRALIPGCTPIHLIESPSPGSGKGLLADLISIIVRGRACDPTTLSRDENEMRKKITAILMSGTSIILLDNITAPVNSAHLAAALTAETWFDRVLGQSRMVEVSNRALWLATANNPQVSMEMARRCVRIRLVPPEERPWERTDFKHDPIRAWALKNRSALVYAILVLVQHWCAEGRPPGRKGMGSFEQWVRVTGGILEAAGVDGFLANTQEFYAAADYENQEWRRFVEQWWERHRDDWVSTSDLHVLATEKDLLGFVLGDSTDRSQKTRLGKALMAMRDRTLADRRVLSDTESHSKVAKYRLVMVKNGEEPKL